MAGIVPAIAQERYFFSIVGFTQPGCITFCDGRKLK
jgi:hypothetical protein